MTLSEELSLEEYKTLRRQIEALQAEVRQVFRLSVIGLAAIYAWLAANQDAGIAAIGWWVPVFIPIFGLSHFLAHIRLVMVLAFYIREHVE